MKTTHQSIQYGVYVDHKRAVVASYDKNGEITLEEIVDGAEPHPRFPGETDTKTREDFNTVNRQNHEQNKLHEDYKKFYKQIISKINNANALVLFGPAEAKHELHKEITNEGKLKDVYIQIEKSENLSHNLIKEFVADYYKNGIKAQA